MKERRFGRSIRLPSILELKHQIVRDRFEQALKMRASTVTAFAGILNDPMARAADNHSGNSRDSDLGNGPISLNSDPTLSLG
jgi:hypothetical protein